MIDKYWSPLTFGILLSVAIYGLACILVLYREPSTDWHLMLMVGGREGTGIGAATIPMKDEAACYLARKSIVFVQRGEERLVGVICLQSPDLVAQQLPRDMLPEGQWYYTPGVGWRCPARRMCPLSAVDGLTDDR